MPGRYGTASAGGRTISDPCSGAFDLGVGCGGGDGEAWWAEGQTWVAFVGGLEAEATKLAPVALWPATLMLSRSVGDAAKKTFSGSAPWLVWEGDIKLYAQAQQDLRNYAGELADFIESKGVKLPKGPADVPPPGMSPWLVLAGLLGAGWLYVEYRKG